MPPHSRLLALAALALAACSGGAGSGAPPPLCAAGATRPCYAGPAGTEGVGVCHAGLETCATDGASWGACAGAVLPAALEICGNGLDDDCNGAVDDSADADGDGWARCEGDCDDGDAGVNPGAYDIAGNGVDEDCSGTPDDAVTACSQASKLAGVTGADLAEALDLCQAALEQEPIKANRRWGVISASLTLADGTGTPDPSQVAVMSRFGPNGPPRTGATMAVLSSGTAREAADPGFVDPWAVKLDGTQSGAPADLLAAHGGALPSFACWVPPDTVAYDPVRLSLRVRVPTNAHGVAFRFRFFAADYPGYLCTSFADPFVAQLTTLADGIPADHAVALTPQGHLITVNDELVTSCTPSGAGPCPLGTEALVDTGYLRANGEGGATNWLETTAPVVPGETITLAFSIWDTGDHGNDSLVLLDGVEWLFGPTTLSTQPAP